jgi:EAL domain-containing protein (putative c-di-GMP-specific phosphodiesterase class I)
LKIFSEHEPGIHAEILLRMLEPDGNLIMPNSFIPAAERYQLATRLDKWVLRNTIECLKNHSNIETIEMVCINLSGQSIGDRAFHRKATALLKSAGESICKLLCLEITETAAVTNIADAALFIEQVHELGVKIALDDCGAGASSFGYLKNLQVDILKIDGQFIQNLLDEPLSDSAVRSFIDVAKVVGLETVAEYVDNPKILARIKELGVNYAQGFLLHKPQSIDEVLSPPKEIDH